MAAMNSTFVIDIRRGQRGFSLVEIMVGVAIGLIGLLVIFKTVAIWDNHTRTASSGGDAQVAGTLAMFNIERDIKLAGLGFGTAPTTEMGCQVDANDTTGRGAFNFRLYPILLAEGVGGAPDVLTVLYGNSSFLSAREEFTGSSLAAKQLPRRSGFRQGDLAVVAGIPAGIPTVTPCALVQITANTNPDTYTLDHANGAFTPDPAYAAASAASRFNDAAGTLGYSTGGIYSLGPIPQLNVWRIGNGRALQLTDFLRNAGPFEVADGVVSLKAIYGVDTDNNDRITGACPGAEWTTTPPADWTKVRAMRVALLVRSSQFERSADATASSAVSAAVTTGNPTWSCGSFLMTNVDGTLDSYSDTNSHPNNWRYYRYQVYEKVIPLRNMIWGQQP